MTTIWQRPREMLQTALVLIVGIVVGVGLALRRERGKDASW